MENVVIKLNVSRHSGGSLAHGMINIGVSKEWEARELMWILIDDIICLLYRAH